MAGNVWQVNVQYDDFWAECFGGLYRRASGNGAPNFVSTHLAQLRHGFDGVEVVIDQ